MGNLCLSQDVTALRLLIAAILLACLGSAARCAAEHGGRRDGKPNIEDYATIESYVNGVPVYAFGYTYIYGVSPDLLPGAVMQEGNTNPVVKFRPKKSWEIKSNLCGSTPAREPKTMWNDDQPLLPVHLIDGDPETAWSSKPSGWFEAAKPGNPEWIRIDLPAESTVAAVALVCSKVGPCVRAQVTEVPDYDATIKVGKALPKSLTIKISCDARQWETVYENKSFSGSDSGPNVISFEPRRAKQIWVIAEDLQYVGFWGYGFSIGELEVRDPGGNDLALLSRGAGVQVSSTYHGFGMDRFTQDMMWPVQYDLGFKWTRVGYDMGMYLWSYVEREKGKLQIDAKADEAVTEASRNGVNVILVLDKGNWLYHDPPRKTDWKKARVYEMMDTYWDHQGWPTDSREMLDGYLRYVEYMVRHFKGRVAYYEILNEWQSIGVENYMNLINAVIPVIKKADPKARIMLGSPSGVDRDRILACLGKERKPWVRGGKFYMEGLWTTIALVDKLEVKDVRVSVSGRSDAEAGFVFRFKDARNYLLAKYAPQSEAVYFQEMVDGWPGACLDPVKVSGLGKDIQVSAGVEGSTATFTVSDGTKDVTTKHTIRRLPDAGGVGLFHSSTGPQFYGDFVLRGADGVSIFEDHFQEPDWQFPGRWVNVKTVEKGLGPRIDAIGWHPWYGMDPDVPGYRTYPALVADIKKECSALGFKGQLAATEWTWWASYPGHPDWCTEMGKAKYSAQRMTADSGMDIISLYNETFQTAHDVDVTLFRNAFSVDPIAPVQPQPIYYVLRSISTAMDGFGAADFPVTFSGEKKFEFYTFKRGRNESMVAAWIPGRTTDGIVEAKSDVVLPGVQVREAWAVDVFNGTQQRLDVSANGGDTVLKAMLIKDYPVFIRIVR